MQEKSIGKAERPKWGSIQSLPKSQLVIGPFLLLHLSPYSISRHKKLETYMGTVFSPKRGGGGGLKFKKNRY